MTRYVRTTMVAAALTTLTAGGAWAQVPPTTPTPTPSPRSTEMSRPATVGIVEGTVKKVDPATGMLRVSSGPFGIFTKSLQVGPDTQVTVDGRESNLAAIQKAAADAPGRERSLANLKATERFMQERPAVR